jgi:prepilin-type N-terminal cleavage/methylation domain-containing protein
MTQRKGFTLVEIMIVVAIIALLAAIAIPSFMKSRQESRRSSCINNLRLIDHAKQQWATALNKLDTDSPASSDIGPYLKSGWPTCPDGGTYTINSMATNPACDKATHTY